MRVGMIGCGKLGKMIGLGIALRGVEVLGYDVNPAAMTPTVPAYESVPPGFEWPASFTFAALAEVVAQCDLIFFAVQTPHEKAYEGITPAPYQPKDFDYTYITHAVREVNAYVTAPTVFVIISTMLPGTCGRELLPLVNEHVTMLYNPSFIAMGTTLRDFWNPELVLIGQRSWDAGDTAAGARLMAFYNAVLHNPPNWRRWRITRPSRRKLFSPTR